VKNVATNAVLAATSAIANRNRTKSVVVIQNQAKNATVVNQNQMIKATNLAAKMIDRTKAIDQAIKTVMNQTVAMIKMDLDKTQLNQY